MYVVVTSSQMEKRPKEVVRARRVVQVCLGQTEYFSHPTRSSPCVICRANQTSILHTHIYDHFSKWRENLKRGNKVIV